MLLLQFLLPPLMADWSWIEGEWLAKAWCGTNMRITPYNIFVFHNSHHARSSNPSVINCCCVSVRKVATLHVTTPTIIVHEFSGHWGGRTRNCQSWGLGGGCPLTQTPLPSMELQQVAFCWHTLHSRLWDMAAQLNTLLSLRMACRAIVTKVQHNVLLFHSSSWQQHRSFSLPWLQLHVSFLASYWSISRIAS